MRQTIILSILLCAFALRTYKITSVPLAVDEATTMGKYVPLAVMDIFTTIHSNNHPMASFLAHLFSPQADNLYLMRWPMILVGMVSLPLIYRLGFETFGQKVGLLALFLMAVSPLHFGYSVIVRGYVGLICLATLSHYFLWRILQHYQWRDWLGFTISNIIIIYFHLFGGVLALGFQLGLLALWWLWILRSSAESWSWLKPKLTQLSLVIVTLGLAHAPMIYLRAQMVLAEGGYPADFDVWRNGVFGWSEDLSPFIIFMRLMGLISPNGWVSYLYLIFLLIGLVSLRQRLPIVSSLTFLWFSLPFVSIFSAHQLLGHNFYAYVRFLLYLLPTYLILVAVGMVTTVNILESLTTAVHDKTCRTGILPVQIRQARCLSYGFCRVLSWRTAGHGAIYCGVIGGLMMVVFSTHGYIFTSTHTHWFGLAQAITQDLQTNDIIICEEGHEFDIPDRAKAHCVWALDLLVPGMVHYTPRLQSSPDAIANVQHLLTTRDSMLKSGHVWLVIWQKIPFSPELFLTNDLPIIKPPLPLALFAPYQAKNFGSATLIRVDSENTLFGNVYKTLELLSQTETSWANQARYQRDLAEMEAVQGHKAQAQQFFQQSWHDVEQAGHMYPALFLSKTKPLIDRLPDPLSPAIKTTALNYPLDPTLCLQAYHLSTETISAGQPLTLTLQWHTLDFVQKDYGYFLQLDNMQRQTLTRLDFQPFDRVYPTTWWWTQQILAEKRPLTLSPDLPKIDYLIQLGVYENESNQPPIIYPLFQLKYDPTLAQWHHVALTLADN